MKFKVELLCGFFIKVKLFNKVIIVITLVKESVHFYLPYFLTYRNYH